MKKPDFDSIKTYEEFKKYEWNRYELINICKEHGLLFNGTDKKLHEVIESYFNGVKIPPRRNWYTNKVLVSWVNENGSLMSFDLTLFTVNLILTVIGMINKIKGTDELRYDLFLVFGLTGLIVAVLFIYWGRDLPVIRSYFPICGDKRFTREQVDEQANSQDTKRLGYADILLAPDMLIGVTAGIAAVAYEDIASLSMKQIHHSERIGPKGSNRYREYYTYKIIVRTNKGKKIAISDSKNDAEYAIKAIHEHCLKYNPQVKIIGMEEFEKPVTEGKDVRRCVDNAVREQHMTSMSVDEDLKKRFISYHLRFALIFIPESLLVAVISAVLLITVTRIVIVVRGGLFLLAGIFLPVYAVYNLISTIKTIRKDDIEFYSCEISNKSYKGYLIKGTYGHRFGYIKKMRPESEPNIGDHVILARFKDEFSLIADNRLT